MSVVIRGCTIFYGDSLIVLLVANGVINQRCSTILMAMPLADTGMTAEEVDVSIPYKNCRTAGTGDQVEMIVIEIRAHCDFVHMAARNRDGWTADRSEAVVVGLVRFGLGPAAIAFLLDIQHGGAILFFCDHNTAQYLMDVAARRDIDAIAGTGVCIRFGIGESVGITFHIVSAAGIGMRTAVVGHVVPLLNGKMGESLAKAGQSHYHAMA